MHNKLYKLVCELFKPCISENVTVAHEPKPRYENLINVNTPVSLTTKVNIFYTAPIFNI